ncbi:MAG: hypothetical protein IKP62_06460 [Salinivirgaceae bacterium]|nr:hypothetical protein [Salinivirgaceae bacterium]
MIIEETTTYAYKLKYIEDVSFGRIRAFAQSFVNELPQELIDDIYDQLNRGLDLLQNEPQMLVYLYSFGNMHEAKLRYAFDQLPDAFREQHKVNIIDYGCGQAIGTMCYADFLRENGIEQNIDTITLIEPSEICLRRAALHAKTFFPNAEISTVCKGFDDLEADDIQCDESTPTLHILSNVLDILDFDLERFAKLIDGQLCGYNQFVCVEPYFNYSDKDNRIAQFAELLDGNISLSKLFKKGELKSDKTWTAQIVCFSVGELEEELQTEVTADDIDACIIDDDKVFYSPDSKRLLSCDEYYEGQCDDEYVELTSNEDILDSYTWNKSDFDRVEPRYSKAYNKYSLIVWLCGRRFVIESRTNAIMDEFEEIHLDAVSGTYVNKETGEEIDYTKLVIKSVA